MLLRPFTGAQPVGVTAPHGPPALRVHRAVVALVLDNRGASGLALDAAACRLEGRFEAREADALPGAAVAPLAGGLAITLEAAREVRRVRLKGRVASVVKLVRLDGATPAGTPSAQAVNGAAFPEPPADFTDRRFLMRVETAGQPETGIAASALDEILVRTRPARPRLALAAPGGEDGAVPFWPPAGPPAGDVVAGAGPALRAALAAHLDGLASPLTGPVAVSLVVESDAPCTLVVQALEVGYRLVAAGFAAPHAAVAKVDLGVPAEGLVAGHLGLALPGGAVVRAAELRTSERLRADRAPGTGWEALEGELERAHRGIDVAPDRSVAARTGALEPGTAHALALGLLAVAPETALRIELRADLGGEPAGRTVAEHALAPLAASARVWAIVALGPVDLLPSQPPWVVLAALRGRAVWLAAAAGARAPTPVRVLPTGRAAEALDGLPLLAELLTAPGAESTEGPLALSVAGVPVAAPPAGADGVRTFDVHAAVAQAMTGTMTGGAPVIVPLALRAAGPGALTVYAPRVEYDLA